MRIRIRRAIAGIIDGVSLSHFFPGVTYDVTDSLGGYLVSSGDADEVPVSPGVMESNEDPSDFSVFGGVIINPLDRAADRPPAKRRRKRR